MRQRRPTVREVGYTEPPVDRPKRDQAHRIDELQWNEAPQGGRPGLAQCITPPAGPPSQAHHSSANSSYSNGCHFSERRSVVRDVTGEGGGRGQEGVGGRLWRHEEIMERQAQQILELKRAIGLEPPEPPPPPPRPRVPPPPPTFEQQMERMMAEARMRLRYE